MSLKKVIQLTQPVSDTMHAPDLPNFKTVAVIMTQATKEISAKVAVAILKDAGGYYWVNSAVQYMDGQVWYKKGTLQYLDFKLALRRAYGLSRKHYAVTASRAFAGLLHDSVVPATEDIDC